MISDVVSHRKSILFTSTLNIEHMIFSEFATRALAVDIGVLENYFLNYNLLFQFTPYPGPPANRAT